jgi:hypothetical protein
MMRSVFHMAGAVPPHSPNPRRGGMFAVAALCQRRNFVGHRPTLQARHGLNRLFERFHPFPPNCHFLSTGSSRGRSDPVFDRFSIINGRPRLFPTKLPPFPAFRRASLIVRPLSRSNSPRSRSSAPIPASSGALPALFCPRSRFVRRLSRSVRHGSRTLRQRSRCKFLEQMLLHFTSRMGLFIILTFPAIETRGRG